jgi:hypothetical protein
MNRMGIRSHLIAAWGNGLLLILHSSVTGYDYDYGLRRLLGLHQGSFSFLSFHERLEVISSSCKARGHGVLSKRRIITIAVGFPGFAFFPPYLVI